MPSGEIYDITKVPEFKEPATIEQVKKNLSIHDLAMSERVDMLAKEIRAEIDQLQNHLDKKIAAVHRNIRANDKVSKILLDLMSALKKNEDDSMWSCPSCGTCVTTSKGESSPTCPKCKDGMVYFGPAFAAEEAFKEALLYAAAIEKVKSDS